MCLLKECADKPAGNNHIGNFFVEEDKAAVEIGAVVWADGDAHAASSNGAGAYFYVDGSILFFKNIDLYLKAYNMG